VEIIDKCMLMWIYPLCLKYFSIPPELTIKGFIFFEYFFYYLFACTLMRAIKPEAGFSLCSSLFFLMVASSARDINIANFTQPFFYGQFYNVADICRVLAILYVFQKQLLRSSLWLVATIPVHMMLAAMAGVAWGIALLTSYGKALFTSKRFYAAVGIVLSGGLAWVLYSFDFNNVTVGKVSLSEWAAWAKLGQCHWFPFTHGFLTYKHTHKLFPYLTFLLLLCHYFPSRESWRLLDRGIVRIAIAANVLTLLGVVISMTTTHPVLLKLALHRSNDLVVLLGLPYILLGLVSDIQTKPLFYKALAVLALLSPFFITDRYVLLPSLLLLTTRFGPFLQLQKAPKTAFKLTFTSRHRLMLGILCLMGLLLAFYVQNGWLAQFPQYFAKYAGFPKSVELFAMAASALAVLIYAFKIPERKLPALMTVLLLLGALNFSNRMSLHGDNKRIATSYLHIQQWAKANTPSQSSFIVTPELSGWRDYSQRSSFGALREWTHDAWLYDSTPTVFYDGMKRVQLVSQGVQPDFALKHHPGNYEALRDYTDRIVQTFYQLSPAWFITTGARYHAQYLVLDKARIKQAYPFEICTENQHFRVYRIPQMQ
jgi:hypothetical protein